MLTSHLHKFVKPRATFEMAFVGSALNDDLIIRYMERTNPDDLLDFVPWMDKMKKSTEALRYAVLNYDRFENPVLKRWSFEVFKESLVYSGHKAIPVSMLSKLTEILIGRHKEVLATGLLEHYVFYSMIVSLVMILYPSYSPDLFSLESANSLLRMMERSVLLPTIMRLSTYICGIPIGIGVLRKPDELLQQMLEDGSQRSIITILVGMMDTPDDLLAQVWGALALVFDTKEIVAEGFVVKLRAICASPESIQFLFSMLESMAIVCESASRGERIADVFDGLEIEQIISESVAHFSHVPTEKLSEVIQRMQQLPARACSRCLPIVTALLQRISSLKREDMVSVQFMLNKIGYNDDCFDLLVTMTVQLLNDFILKLDKDTKNSLDQCITLVMDLILLSDSEASRKFNAFLERMASSISDASGLYAFLWVWSNKRLWSKFWRLAGDFVETVQRTFGQMIADTGLGSERELGIKTKYCKILMLDRERRGDDVLASIFFQLIEQQTIEGLLAHCQRHLRILARLMREIGVYRQVSPTQSLATATTLIRTKNIFLIDCARELIAHIDGSAVDIGVLVPLIVESFQTERFDTWTVEGIAMLLKCVQQINQSLLGSRSKDFMPLLLQMYNTIGGDLDKISRFIAYTPGIVGIDALQWWVEGMSLLHSANKAVSISDYTCLDHIDFSTCEHHLSVISKAMELLITAIRNQSHQRHMRAYDHHQVLDTRVVTETAIVLGLSAITSLDPGSISFLMYNACSLLASGEMRHKTVTRVLDYAMSDFQPEPLRTFALSVFSGLLAITRLVQTGTKTPFSVLDAYTSYLNFLRAATEKLGRQQMSDIISRKIHRPDSVSEIINHCVRFILDGDVSITTLQDELKSVTIEC